MRPKSAGLSPDREPGAAVLEWRGAFSLVELAMALGIFSFAIIAVIGLLLTVTKSDKGAATDTTLAQMVESTVTQLRSKDFESVHTNAGFADANPDFYYDVSGKMARDAGGNPVVAAAADSIFGCIVTRGNSPSTNMDYLVLDFRWPVTAPAANQQSRKLTASFAKYD